MSKEFSPDRLDVAAFAKAGATLSGVDPISQFPRLASEAGQVHGMHQVGWQAEGEHVPESGGPGHLWLHLSVQALVPMTCQRCLQAADIALDVERSFRFVKDEATAEAMDDESEEDLLALSKEFALRELIEDELLMELPVVPKHDECPQEVNLASSDEDFEQAVSDKPNPFAVLASLRKNGEEGSA